MLSPIDRKHNSGGENEAVRRQTATGGINPAGSSRDLRLDPLSLPVSFAARDSRADGGIRQIELHRECVTLRRAVRGMQMTINVRVSEFIGVTVRDTADGRMLVLLHRDPSLAIPLLVTEDATELAPYGASLERDFRASAACRRQARSCATPTTEQYDQRRRPTFLVRRRGGDLLNPAADLSGRARDHRAT